MLRRTPLKARAKYKPVAVRRHHDFVASLGCLVCGAPAEVHHVTGYADKPGRFARSDWLVVPLCPPHHRIGCDPYSRIPQSVEALGHQGFFDEFGLDLLQEAMRLADQFREEAA